MICYDIFDLADFPIIITGRNFVIQHKNSIAKIFFSGFRKRSKITLYTNDLDKDTDLSEPKEIEFSQGTQYKRALVFVYDEKSVFFIFLSSLQFENSATVLERIKEGFGGNFLDFYISAYNAYRQSQTSCESLYPVRLLDDLLLLMKASRDKLFFMNKEIFNIAEIFELTSAKVCKALSSLGYKISTAAISNNVKNLCFSKINIDEFFFILFKMLYVCLKISSNKLICASLDYDVDGYAAIRLQTKVPEDICNSKDSSCSIIDSLSELSMEMAILKKMQVFEKNVVCRIKDRIFDLELKINCIINFNDLPLHSSDAKKRKKALNRAISANISKIRKLLKNSI